MKSSVTSASEIVARLHFTNSNTFSEINGSFFLKKSANFFRITFSVSSVKISIYYVPTTITSVCLYGPSFKSSSSSNASLYVFSFSQFLFDLRSLFEKFDLIRLGWNLPLELAFRVAGAKCFKLRKWKLHENCMKIAKSTFFWQKSWKTFWGTVGRRWGDGGGREGGGWEHKKVFWLVGRIPHSRGNLFWCV